MRNPYRTHTEGRIRGLLRDLNLKRRQPRPDQTGEPLIGRPVTGSESTLTYAEEAELLIARAAMDSIEGRHNAEASEGLSKLASAAPALAHAVTDQSKAQSEETTASKRRDEFEALLHQDGLETRAARHMSRGGRLALLGVFSIADVIAFRAAIAYLLDAPDDWFGRGETLLFALISIAIPPAAGYGGERVRYWLDARRAHNAELTDAIEPQAAADDLRYTGIPALVSAFCMLIAAAALRIEALGSEQSAIVWIAVPVFSLASLVGAVVVELMYANAYLDKLDHFRKEADMAAAERRDSDGRVERLRRSYDALEVRLTTLWSTHEPSWVMQADIAAQRIAAARASRPDLFHPLASDIKPLVEDRLRSHSRVLDVGTEISVRGLAASQILVGSRPADEASAETSSPDTLPEMLVEAPDNELEELTDADLERLALGSDEQTPSLS